LIAFNTAVASKLPATTWYVKILAKVALFSGFKRLSTVPFGNLAKASFVGAKTVKGPALCKVATKSAAFTAATKVVCALEPTATSTTVF